MLNHIVLRFHTCLKFDIKFGMWTQFKHVLKPDVFLAITLHTDILNFLWWWDNPHYSLWCLCNLPERSPLFIIRYFFVKTLRGSANRSWFFSSLRDTRWDQENYGNNNMDYSNQWYYAVVLFTLVLFVYFLEDISRCLSGGPEMILSCFGNSYLHSREFESTEGPSEISGVRAGTSVAGLWKTSAF